MQMTPRFRRSAMLALLLTLSTGLVAQGKHDRDDHDNSGHGGGPPGQAKKYDHDDHDRDRDNRGLPPGQAKRMDEGRGLPPGQAKKYFRDRDRDGFYAHYRGDADHWRGRSRPVFVVGQPVVRTYVIQPVPRSVWVSVSAPPPPNCQYGYYGGYVVAYNPTTRVIADVLDLVDAVKH